jgi:hypothetical protein
MVIMDAPCPVAKAARARSSERLDQFGAEGDRRGLLEDKRADKQKSSGNRRY